MIILPMYIFFRKTEITKEHAVYLVVSGHCHPRTTKSNFIWNRSFMFLNSITDMMQPPTTKMSTSYENDTATKTFLQKLKKCFTVEKTAVVAGVEPYLCVLRQNVTYPIGMRTVTRNALHNCNTFPMYVAKAIFFKILIHYFQLQIGKRILQSIQGCNLVYYFLCYIKTVYNMLKNVNFDSKTYLTFKQ